ncbi:putative signal transduction histidine kinase [Herpetosiphon aurantiacus DSM 785]|uniref:Signal transduction histidine kinase n=2 Tax=Herpetosiphon TaxID=64 RepID=A9B572_HERA2|nr:putative signal transduction histidine kinase [Herpetosiphon aurantiacus DSM 785]
MKGVDDALDKHPNQPITESFMKRLLLHIRCFLMAGGNLYALRTGLLPCLLAWTAWRHPHYVALALGLSSFSYLVHYLRYAERWPIGRMPWIDQWAEFGLALLMPLIATGWYSPWLFDTWLMLAATAHQLSRRSSPTLGIVWLGYSVALFASNPLGQTNPMLFCMLVLGVPAILLISIKPQEVEPIPQPSSRMLSSLQTAQRRFELIRAIIDHAQRSAMVEAVYHQAQHGVRDLSLLIDDITPQAVQPSLIERFKPIIERWKINNGIDVAFHTTIVPQQLNPSIEALFVRTLEETLNNVARHAQASLVEISLRSDEQHISLIVRDNGIGLVYGTTQRAGSRGLRWLRYRAQEINGYLDAYDGVDGGLVVQLSIPLTVYVT